MDSEQSISRSTTNNDNLSLKPSEANQQDTDFSNDDELQNDQQQHDRPKFLFDDDQNKDDYVELELPQNLDGLTSKRLHDIIETQLLEYEIDEEDGNFFKFSIYKKCIKT